MFTVEYVDKTYVTYVMLELRRGKKNCLAI